MIVIEQLSKRFSERPVLEVPSWRVNKGEIVGLVGSNGAGKTTFMRLLLDLLAPDTGVVSLDGHVVSESDAWKAFTGSYLDRQFLVDFLTPSEFLDFVRTVNGMTRTESDHALADFESFLPANGKANRYLRDLSTGDAKKVGIAAAMFAAPQLLILDEPFANLDPPSQLQLKALLRDLHARHGTTMLISSHDLGHVTELCDRITVVNDGRFVRNVQASPESLAELTEFFASVATT